MSSPIIETVVLDKCPKHTRVLDCVDGGVFDQGLVQQHTESYNLFMRDDLGIVLDKSKPIRVDVRVGTKKEIEIRRAKEERKQKRKLAALERLNVKTRTASEKKKTRGATSSTAATSTSAVPSTLSVKQKTDEEKKDEKKDEKTKDRDGDSKMDNEKAREKEKPFQWPSHLPKLDEFFEMKKKEKKAQFKVLQEQGRDAVGTRYCIVVKPYDHHMARPTWKPLKNLFGVRVHEKDPNAHEYESNTVVKPETLSSKSKNKATAAAAKAKNQNKSKTKRINKRTKENKTKTTDEKNGNGNENTNAEGKTDGQGEKGNEQDEKKDGKDDNDKEVPLLPYDCGRFDKNYGGKLSSKIRIYLEVTLWNEEKQLDIVNEYPLPHNGETVQLASEIMVMLFSNYCNLTEREFPHKRLSDTELVALKEDPINTGGYFIENGKPVVVVQEETNASFDIRTRQGKGDDPFAEFEGQEPDSIYNTDKFSIRFDRVASTKDDVRKRNRTDTASQTLGTAKKKPSRISNIFTPWKDFDMQKEGQEITENRPKLFAQIKNDIYNDDGEKISDKTRMKLAIQKMAAQEMSLKTAFAKRRVLKAQLNIGEQTVVLPLVVMFRAFGIMTIEEIEKYVFLMDTPEVFAKYRDELRYSCKADEGVNTQHEALLRIGKLKTKSGETLTPHELAKQGKYFLQHRMYRHLGIEDSLKTWKAKLMFMSLIVNQQLKRLVDINNATKREHFENRHVVIPREVLRMTARSGYRVFIDAMTQLLRKDCYKLIHDSLADSFKSCDVFKREMRKLKSRRDRVKNPTTNSGVKGTMETLNKRQTASNQDHVVDRVNKHTGAGLRSYNQTRVGFFDLVITAIGEGSGLVNDRAILATVTMGLPTAHRNMIIEQLVLPRLLPCDSILQSEPLPFNLDPPPPPSPTPTPHTMSFEEEEEEEKQEETPNEAEEKKEKKEKKKEKKKENPENGKEEKKKTEEKTKWQQAPPGSVIVMFDGCFLGVEPNPAELYQLLRDVKLHPDATTRMRQMGIVWKKPEHEIVIKTDAGRMIQPQWLLDEKTQHIRITKSLAERWQREEEALSKGQQDLRDPLFDPLWDPETIAVTRHERQKREELKAEWRNLVRSACIEWRDVLSQNYSLVCPFYPILYGLRPEMDERLKGDGQAKYETCLIHPVALLGNVSSNLPFVDYTNNIRQVYEGSMIKQNVSAAPAHNAKLLNTKTIFMLVYAQLPLVRTRSSAYAFGDVLPSYINVLETYMNYNGNNEEDARQTTKLAIDTGMALIDQSVTEHFETWPTREMAIEDLIARIEQRSKRRKIPKRQQKALSVSMFSKKLGSKHMGTSTTKRKPKNTGSHPTGTSGPASTGSVIDKRTKAGRANSKLKSSTLASSSSSASATSMSTTAGDNNSNDAGSGSGNGSGNGNGSVADAVQPHINPSVADLNEMQQQQHLQQQQQQQIIDEDEYEKKKNNFSDELGELYSTYIYEEHPAVITEQMLEHMSVADMENVFRDQKINPKTNIVYENSKMGFKDTLYRLVIITESDLENYLEKNRIRQESQSRNANGNHGDHGDHGEEGIRDEETFEDLPIRYRRVYINQHQTTIASRVIINPDEKGMLRINIILDRKRNSELGDKFSDRNGAKGVNSEMLRIEETPWRDKDGVFVEAISNSHSIPTRKPYGRIYEIVRSAVAVQHPDLVLTGDDLPIHLMAQFSSKIMASKPWENEMDQITCEFLSRMSTAALTWKKTEVASKDAFNISNGIM